MKILVLAVSLGLVAVAGPRFIREIHHRFIAVDYSGLPLNEIFQCPSCQRSSVVEDPAGSDRSCTGCGHTWNPEALAVAAWSADR